MNPYGQIWGLVDDLPTTTATTTTTAAAVTTPRPEPTVSAVEPDPDVEAAMQQFRAQHRMQMLMTDSLRDSAGHGPPPPDWHLRSMASDVDADDETETAPRWRQAPPLESSGCIPFVYGQPRETLESDRVSYTTAPEPEPEPDDGDGDGEEEEERRSGRSFCETADEREWRERALIASLLGVRMEEGRPHENGSRRGGARDEPVEAATVRSPYFSRPASRAGTPRRRARSPSPSPSPSRSRSRSRSLSRPRKRARTHAVSPPPSDSRPVSEERNGLPPEFEVPGAESSAYETEARGGAVPRNNQRPPVGWIEPPVPRPARAAGARPRDSSDRGDNSIGYGLMGDVGCVIDTDCGHGGRGGGDGISSDDEDDDGRIWCFGCQWGAHGHRPVDHEKIRDLCDCFMNLILGGSTTLENMARIVSQQYRDTIRRPAAAIGHSLPDWPPATVQRHIENMTEPRVVQALTLRRHLALMKHVYRDAVWLDPATGETSVKLPHLRTWTQMIRTLHDLQRQVPRDAFGYNEHLRAEAWSGSTLVHPTRVRAPASRQAFLGAPVASLANQAGARRNTLAPGGADTGELRCAANDESLIRRPMRRVGSIASGTPTDTH